MYAETFSGTRGLYDSKFLDLAGKYAKAYSDFLKQANEQPTAVVGYDSRQSSPKIFEKMCRVMNGQGIKVIGVGIMPTPAVEHAVRILRCDGGIIITGSHNEPEHNGWKLLQGNGGILTIDQITKVIAASKSARYQEGKFSFADKHDEIKESYCRFIADHVGTVNYSKRFILDPNGGAACVVLPRILDLLGLKGTVVNGLPGKFVRLVEPNPTSLKYLKKTIISNDAELAFGLDSDADRVEMIKADGEVIDGNYTLAMAMDLVLEEEKGPVVINDATSNLIHDICKRHGVSVVEVEVGETNVVEKMYELNSPIGGEGSNGGVIVPPNRCRDGILTTFQILKYLSGKDFQDAIKTYPKYYEMRENLRVEEDVAALNRKLAADFKKRGYTVIRNGDELGTVKIVLADGWLFFRCSRTEPGNYRIIANTKSREKTKELLDLGIKALKQ